MKNTTWIVACACLFVSVAGFAQAPSPAPLTKEALAAILGPSAVAGSCSTQPSRVLFAAKSPRTGLEKALCMATASCESGTVSCEGNNSVTSCSASDRSCPGEQGHVTCDGVTTWCPTVCSCNTGTPKERACCRCEQSGGCMDCCRCDGGTIGQCAIQCG